MKIFGFLQKKTKSKSEQLSTTDIESLQKVIGDCEFIAKLCEDCYRDAAKNDSNEEFMEIFGEKIQGDRRRIDNFKKRVGVC